MSQGGPEKKDKTFTKMSCGLFILVPTNEACFVDIVCMYCLVDMSFEASMAVNIRIVCTHLPD
jgi:hypothetical protein